jgi:hypothetical protein
MQKGGFRAAFFMFLNRSAGARRVAFDNSRPAQASFPCVHCIIFG